MSAVGWRAWAAGLVAPHPSVADPETRRRVRLLLAVSLTSAVLTAASLAVTPFVGTFGPEGVWAQEGQSAVSLLILAATFVLARGPHPRRGVLVFILAQNAAIWFSVYLASGLEQHDAMLLFLLVPMGAAALLEGPALTWALTLFNTVAAVAFQLDNGRPSAVWVSATALLLVGALLAVVARFRRRDLAQIAAQESALRESEANFRLLATSAREGVLVHSPSRVLLANPAALRLVGRGPEELGALRPEELFAPESRAARQGHIGAGGAAFYTAELLRGDGSRLAVEVVSDAILFRGQEARVMAIRDVTAHRLALAFLESAQASAAAAAQAKGEFLASMSHEVRTPINAMVGAADLLAGTPLSPEQHELVAALRTSGEHLVSLVDDILDYSKAEQGELRLHPSPCDPARLLADVVRLCEPTARQKGILLTLEGTPGALVAADARRIRQVLLNLVSNAVKFTPQGGTVAARVAVGPVAGGRRSVRYEVADTGVGMDLALQARLFQPFVQADQGMTRIHEGAGLGLAISHRLALALGGGLEVESAPGRGSTFRFWLDAAAEATPPPEPTAELPPAPASVPSPGPKAAATAPLRILVAEDNPTNRLLLDRMLKRLGQAADLVGDGEAALDAVGRASYDLVLMDLHMPRLDGLEATRRIRAAGHRVRIVAITADAMAGDRERCLAAGMDGYLAKPIRLADLEAALAEAVPAVEA